MNLTTFQHQALVHALDKMYKKDFFSICTVDEIADMLNKPIRGTLHNTLRTLHCVYWADMTPEFREEVKEKISELLGLDAILKKEEKVVIGSRIPDEEDTLYLHSATNNSKIPVKLAFWRNK